MAKFMNVHNEEDSDLSLNEDETLESFDNEPEEGNPVEEPEDVEVDDDIPDKYKGKSAKEIIAMHQEAEKLVGRHSSELGDLRKIVDDFIRTNSNKENESPKQSEPEVDFWDDPEAAIERKLANHPAIKQAEETSKQYTQQQVLNRLNTEYPDWEDTIQDAAFAEWVRGSKIRMTLYAEASNNFDWDAADELLGNWQQLTKTKATAQETAKADVKEQRKAASTGSSKASDAQPSRKIYRRADIVNLMRNDPKRYAQLSDEIFKAYAEGRVR